MIKLAIIALSAILLASCSCKVPREYPNVLVRKCDDGNYLLMTHKGDFILAHYSDWADRYELVDKNSIDEVCHKDS